MAQASAPATDRESHWSCAWPAPAKINLFLHVTGRRSNGYHELQTLLQFIDAADALAFRCRDDGEIALELGADGVVPAEDLAVRAAHALQCHAGVEAGADIAVTKQLPLGGGLGGGSSDAATTLVGLYHLWGAGLDIDELAALGLELGADVPFFVRGYAAWGEGVGEHLTPVEPREPWYVVVVPGVSVPTATIFQAPELTRSHPLITIRDFFAGAGGNDCIEPVRARYPEVAEALDWLEGQGAVPRLSGTGSSVFAAFADEASARSMAQRVPAQWRARVARGRNRSPLATRMAALAGDAVTS